MRLLRPDWNWGLIIASIGISFLGSFTASQLMCHARLSVRFTSVLLWSLFASLVFGFCAIWSLHEVAMLACDFDVPIGIDAPLTVLSSILAVLFTFAALSGDLLWERYTNPVRRRRKASRNRRTRIRTVKGLSQSSAPLLRPEDAEGDEMIDAEPDNGVDPSVETLLTPPYNAGYQDRPQSSETLNGLFPARSPSDCSQTRDDVAGDPAQSEQSPSEGTDSRRGSLTDTHSGSLTIRSSSNGSSLGLNSALGILAGRTVGPARNVFVALFDTLYTECNCRNVGKGLLWSLAITSMHYVGLFGLKIPNGTLRFNIWLVMLSALISWVVCSVGAILMPAMETRILQQVLFSVIAAAGVSGMHFTGMSATRFYSSDPSSSVHGYPPALANSVVLIAFCTCIAANMLLAHSATASRIKLAEIVATRRELWRTIALKENAEASARARSDFIASASHEIRTPLHHLQGYSDLLAHTELTPEGRQLLTSIQRATKTLSLITNNVLDWSKFERHSENSYRPTALDLRAVCESIIVLLPNIDDDTDVQLFVVVSSDVPQSVYLDEMYMHRIIMNLISNSMKFTRCGYILLDIHLKDDNLVVVVKDTGCGLDPNFVPDMWTPFKQGEVRGSARGTGLGLSIIKRLLERMHGVIEVESKYMHLVDIGPEQSGTTFTVTIPLQSTMARLETSPLKDLPRIAILSKNQSRSVEGFKHGWESFDFHVEMVINVESVVCSGPWKYVWAELDFLEANPAQYAQLLRHKKLTVLVPYDTHDSLERLPGILSAKNFVMLPKPLIWHTFERRVTASRHRRGSTAPSQALRFAAEVEIMNEEAKSAPDVAERSGKILVVEDNSINQKLATKMLTKLGYSVMLANDGEDAIALMLQYHNTIDLILMDQSMPRKDGVTATREIRELEAVGQLSQRTPLIAVTAVVNPEAQSAFHDAGADHFLAKPLSLDRLKDILDLYLSQTVAKQVFPDIAPN
ncbi:hypothetical protein EJ08DRAFT_595916 [Tothia fuscella]|uniref:Histidine kinase n=1 Tax=Tothia fuscella TaxID=1048955 RepID=A0A9P4NJP6_9PEZI|nr:hypothetical protein EJ08DRAFT_595916 [Tothia fuscella]